MTIKIKKAYDAVTSQAKRKVMSRLIEPPFFYSSIHSISSEYKER